MRLFQLALLLVLSVSSLAFGQGFDSNYEVRLGAFSGSTADDLYISQTPQITILPNEITIPIVLPAPVEDFVLENNGDGTFTLIDDLTDIESSVASNWAEVSIELSLGDFNADGYADLFLGDVGSVLASAYDQMVFSDMAEQVPPQAVTAITPDVEQFFEDIVGWLMDENYFENEAYANNWYNIIHGSNFWAYWKTSYLQAWGATYAGVVIININEDPYNPANAPASCNVIATCVFMNGQWYLWGGFHTHSIEYDYSNFDQDALGIISSGSLSNITNSGELVAGSADAVAIANVFANIIGTSYMGGVLNVSGPLLDDEVINDPQLDSSRLLRLLSFLGDYIKIIEIELPVLPNAPNDTTPDPNISETEKLNTTLSKAVYPGNGNIFIDSPGSNLIIDELPEETIISVAVTVSSTSPIERAAAKKGIEDKWNSSIVGPDGHKYTIKTTVTPVNRNGNVSVDRDTCTTINALGCADQNNNIIHIILGVGENEVFEAVVAHEFGHIIGLGDTYVNVNDYAEPLLGHEDDIMSTGESLHWYHLETIRQKHSLNNW